MKYFDANACLGVDLVEHEVVNHECFIVLEKVDTANNALKLIDCMDYVGIEKAAVWHRAMYDLDPTVGNKKIIREINGYEDRLIPTWTVLPSITDKEYETKIFFDEMEKNNVKMLRAFPQKNRYILCKVTMEDQLRLMSELRIPLYLEPQNGFEYIYNILKEFPDLTIIMCNIGCWPSARIIFPLLKNYKNFYFETGDFGMLKGYEQVCEYYGSERMLFGTNFPTNNMACSINCLLNAKISDENKENIMHRNMERILSEVKI